MSWKAPFPVFAVSPYVPQLWSPEKLNERRRRARLTSYEPLLLAAAAIGGGVVLDRYASLGAWQLLIAALLLGVWFWLWRRACHVVSAVTLLMLLALLAGGWHNARWRLFYEDDLGRFAGVTSLPVCLEVVALESPARRAAPEPSPYRAIPGGESSRLDVRLVRLRDGTSWRAVSGGCRLTIDGHLLGVRAGDRLTVFGQLSEPSPALNPGEFAAAADQRAERRLCRVRCESPDCVVIAAQGRWLSPRRWIDGAKRWGEQTLIRRMGPDRGGLAAAMVVGSRDRLPKTTVDRFRHAGEVHVLVVSGLHVGLVISAFYFIARMGWVPRWQSLLVIMIAIAAYALVTGARPPVVRAAVLAELLCVALWTGRTVLVMNSLGAAAIVVLALNPCELFRTGAQLSFLAAATLIWFGRWQMEREASLDPMTRLLRSSESLARKAVRRVARSSWLIFLATAAVWIVAAPLMTYRLNLLSPVAMPLSVVVFPLVAVAVVSGLLVLVTEFAMPVAAPLAAAVSGQSCASLDWIVQQGEAAPLVSYFHVPGPALWWVLAAYALMAAALRWGARAGVRKALVYAALVLILAGVAPATASRLCRPAEDAPLRCTFIAVGHGVSVLIESPEGGVVLCDAGSLGTPWIATDRVASVLWSKGITRLDAVVLSHADVDHFNALPGLLERFRVDAVYTSHQMFPRTLLPDEHNAPAELMRLLGARGIPIHRLALGDRVRLSRVEMGILHPDVLGVLESDNADSLVLGIEFAGRRILLPGDLEGRGLEQVLMQEPYDCDVLLAPHHGSPRSDPPGLAAWCQPEVVVISNAPGDDSREVTHNYEAAGAEVLSTAECGAVTVEVGISELRVDCYRD